MFDVVATNLILTGLFFFPHLLSFQDKNKLRFMIFKFLSPSSHPNVFWSSFYTKEALFVAWRVTFYLNYKQLLQLMAIFRSASDLRRVLALC